MGDPHLLSLGLIHFLVNLIGSNDQTGNPPSPTVNSHPQASIGRTPEGTTISEIPLTPSLWYNLITPESPPPPPLIQQLNGGVFVWVRRREDRPGVVSAEELAKLSRPAMPGRLTSGRPKGSQGFFLGEDHGCEGFFLGDHGG